MHLHTKYFGEIKVNQQDIITFPQGVPGFQDEKEFVLLPLEDNPVFQVLQSTNEQELAFIVVNPFLFVKDYEFDIDENTIESLDIQSETDVQILSIVSLREPFETSTANLQAPIVINQVKKIGKQYITNIKKFATKEAIFTPQLTSQVKED
ncbi:flagellar assembly protein FliW [Aquibacillus halophilus]|uniref:Flagellar assembly factor FliW n=1 Tax=Aquibacillus halophilus TaxID=930132 RepID=A0A6A8D887_9BACI|nr:flagellar assembly protein FliW [Aquibacillus halophilus]MRH41973.1 flagellar assembly protein FliW [Aquibacillus halophilus]